LNFFSPIFFPLLFFLQIFAALAQVCVQTEDFQRAMRLLVSMRAMTDALALQVLVKPTCCEIHLCAAN
jgi:hypothetical protein